MENEDIFDIEKEGHDELIGQEDVEENDKVIIMGKKKKRRRKREKEKGKAK